MRKAIKNILKTLIVPVLCCVMAACAPVAAPINAPNAPMVTFGRARRSIVLGDCRVKYVGAVITKDAEGRDVVVFTFDFANKSDNVRTFVYTIRNEAYQDGVALERADQTFVGESDNRFAQVESGGHVHVKQMWTLRSLLSDITVKMSLVDDPFGTERGVTVRTADLPTL